MNGAILERALRGEATDEELRAVAAWRRESPANEQEYRRLRALLVVARQLRQSAVVKARPTAAAVIAAAERRSRTRWWSFVRGAPWIGAAAAAALLFFVLWPDRSVAPSGWEASEVVTGTAELATVKLADGTVVRLAPESRLSVESGRMREVSLEGRAFFAVTKAPDGRPFLVHTSSATAQVLGTRFELVSSPDSVHLLVVEGRVALDTPGSSVEVAAGEESGVRRGMDAAPPRMAELRAAPAWIGRFLAFQNTPFVLAAREIERLYDVRVVIEEPALERATLTATFTDRTLEDVVDVVCAALAARCRSADGVVSVTR